MTITHLFIFAAITMIGVVIFTLAQSNSPSDGQSTGGGVMNSSTPSAPSYTHGGGAMNSGTATRTQSTEYTREEMDQMEEANEMDGVKEPDLFDNDNGRSDRNSNASSSNGNTLNGDFDDENDDDGVESDDQSRGIMRSN